VGGLISRHRRRVIGVLAAVSAAVTLAGVDLAPSAVAHSATPVKTRGVESVAVRSVTPHAVQKPAVGKKANAQHVVGLIRTGFASPLALPSRVLTTSPSAPEAGGLVPLTLGSGRQVWLHLPADADTEPHRLLLMLHGWHLTPSKTEAATGLDAVGDKNGLIVAYGSGIGSSWNAGTCCGLAAADHVDDVQYVIDAIQAIEVAYPVVTDDVVVAGFSNGGMLALEAACDRPDVIHAAASVAGTLTTSCPHPTRLLHIHGLEDHTVPYDGGYSAYTKSTFPAAWLERAKLPRGSHYALYAWKGAHAWPTKATGLDADALIVRLF
jgi:pimeloyl-ACP methyl ester carboxylesterase